MCETRTCQFCINGQTRVQLTDGTYAHEFENPETKLAWCEPCKDVPLTLCDHGEASCPRPINKKCSDVDPNLCCGGGATPSGMGAPCDCFDCHPDIRGSLDYGKDGKPGMLTVRTETDTPSFFCCDHPNQENIWEDLCAAINSPPIKWRGFDVMNAIAVRHGLDKLKAEERVTAVEAENKELRSKLDALLKAGKT